MLWPQKIKVWSNLLLLLIFTNVLGLAKPESEIKLWKSNNFPRIRSISEVLPVSKSEMNTGRQSREMRTPQKSRHNNRHLTEQELRVIDAQVRRRAHKNKDHSQTHYVVRNHITKEKKDFEDEIESLVESLADYVLEGISSTILKDKEESSTTTTIVAASSSTNKTSPNKWNYVVEYEEPQLDLHSFIHGEKITSVLEEEAAKPLVVYVPVPTVTTTTSTTTSTTSTTTTSTTTTPAITTSNTTVRNTAVISTTLASTKRVHSHKRKSQTGKPYFSYSFAAKSESLFFSLFSQTIWTQQLE